MQSLRQRTARPLDMIEKRLIEFRGESRARQVVITRPLVAQRAFDQNEIGSWSDGIDPARGGDTDEQPAVRREELLCGQNSKGGADRAADDPDLAEAVEIEGQKFGVVAGPTLMDAPRAGPLEMANDVTVRIEQISGTATSANRLCRRASLNRDSGRNTEGAV
jgi:hypothetical protein